tara:strand:+ start:1803 stop:1991 length:189 start_codon:yes stop_codon:yes gene_type:complete
LFSKIKRLEQETEKNDTSTYPVQDIFWENVRKCDGIAVFLGGSSEFFTCFPANLQMKTERGA